ncbi:MAG: methionyl-tRNA formyltransferase, partial [Duncaniella sp.]|nr:methionyl-tRNA formyltransferase [Duncaniella sp.]
MKKEDIKIVFLGTPDFAVESLRRIVEGGYNVVGVITMPDKPAGRGHKLLQSPVKQYAVEKGLHLMQPVKLKDPEFVEELRSLDADLFIVIAFRMLPEVVWSMPRLGTFNLHASLLPRYRGAAPINWAVINGDTETGVTTFFLKHEIDTGDIIAQERVDILPTDNVGDVHDRLMMLGADLTIDTIESIIDGTLKTVPQEQLIGDTEPTPAPKIFKETCRIDWNRPAREIHNLVRGLSPYPAAWSVLTDDGKEVGSVKIFETAVLDGGADVEPGQIVIDRYRLMVGCSD